MRKTLISFIMLITWQSALAQEQSSLFTKVDSLLTASAYQIAVDFIDQQKKIVNQNEIDWLDLKKVEALIALGKLTEAEELLNSVVSRPEYQGIALTNQGYLQLNKGRYDLALQSLEQAQQKFQEAGKQNTREGARCLSTLGLAYSTTGKYKQAESNQNMALQIRLSLFGNQSEEVAASYNDLGLVYSETDPDKALEYFEMALPIYEKLHGKDHAKIAIASTNIGFSYLKLSLYGDAINNFETSLAIWRKIYPNGHPNEALTLSNLGQTYFKMGNNKVAHEYFEKALVIFKKSYGSKHSDISQTLNQIGNLKLKENNFNLALQIFQQAIIANSLHFENQDISQNPTISDYYNANVLLYTLQYKTQALEALY